MAHNDVPPHVQAVSIVRAFLQATVIDDVQQNRIRLSGLPPLIRMLGIVIIGLLGLTTVLMIFAGNLREAFRVIVITTESYPNGLLLPSTAIGLVLFLLCMAWSFLLVAIQHSAWWIKVPGVCIHLFLIGTWIINLAQSEIWLFGVVMVIIIIQAIIILHPSRSHLVRSWVFIAVCESIILALPHVIYFEQYQISGIGLLFTSVANFIQSQFAFVTPMLFLVGISMAQAALNISEWSTHTVHHIGARTLYGVLIGCVLWRLLLIEDYAIPDLNILTSLILYSAGFIAIVYGIRTLQPQFRPTSADITDTLERGAPWMILAHLAPLIIQIIVINMFGLVAMIAVVLGYDISAMLNTFSQIITQRSSEIQFIIALLLVAYALRLWRQGVYLRGAFFGVTAYHLAWRVAVNYLGLTVPNVLIEHVFFGGALVYTVVGWMRGTLTTPQIHGFLFVTICSVLLLNADFLNNPLSPVLGFAGIIFIAIGVVWDVLFGSRWVNVDSVRYPRPVRLFFYLGYSLLTTILAFWAVLSQNTGMTNLLTGDIALLAMHTFATPMLHLFFFFMLLWPAHIIKAQS